MYLAKGIEPGITNKIVHHTILNNSVIKCFSIFKTVLLFSHFSLETEIFMLSCILGYHDTGAYPAPTYYNPIPWHPNPIPKTQKTERSKSRPRSKKYVWNPDKYFWMLETVIIYCVFSDKLWMIVNQLWFSFRAFKGVDVRM